MQVSTSSSIRAGRSTDIAKCREIDRATQQQFEAGGYAEVSSSEAIPDRVLERAVRAGRVLVAEIDGQVVGWAFLTRSDGELCIGQLAVATIAAPRRRHRTGSMPTDHCDLRCF